MSGNLSSISGNMEIRKLKSISPSYATKLIQLLDENDSWKLLMSVIPKVISSVPTTEEYTNKKYTTDHIRLIEKASKKDLRSPAEIFLFEWGTTGRTRPTMAQLLILLKSANLYRAADYISMDILNQRPVDRPTTGPAAKINILSLDEELEDIANENPQVSNVTIENNLDNSKPQNLYPGGEAKLMVPIYNQRTSSSKDGNGNTTTPVEKQNIPVLEITAATSSFNGSEDANLSLTPTQNVNVEECDSSTCHVDNIVLQSPPESVLVSDVVVERPNISGLLEISHSNQAVAESEELVSTSSTISSCDITSASANISLTDCGENIPHLSGLLPVVNKPNLSDLLKDSQSSLYFDSSKDVSSQSTSWISDDELSNRPNLSTLLDVGTSEDINRPNLSDLLVTPWLNKSSEVSTSNAIPNFENLMTLEAKSSNKLSTD